MINAAGVECCGPNSCCMYHAYGQPAPRYSGMTRAMAEAALKMRRERVALPEDYIAAAKEVLNK